MPVQLEPKVFSIIMPSYNQAKFIKEAIGSVMAQKGEFFIDFVVKDGASTDGAIDIIKSFEASLSELPIKLNRDLNFRHDPDKLKIKCLGISFRWSSQKDKGFADALNSGLKEIEGDFFSYLNTDDFLLPDCLNTVVRAFDINPNATAIYGEAWEVDEVGAKINRYGTKDIEFNKLADGNFISQPSMFVKTEAVKRAGGFNESIKNSIDYEYWLRLESLGSKFKYLDKYLSATRIYQNTKTMRNRRQIILETLAIQLHYDGDIYQVDPEFMWGTSFFGKYLFKLLPRSIWRFIFSLVSKLWIRLKQKQLNQLRISLFK